ncbi:2,3-bisphosphoglycerate-dependent phosphoglycerate mutase [Pseudopedobacter beijingensis]|uniref:2,3-bisphosphoglycerate-dependent phosphoglycerate mutase n=1 Tax=Pseudopedobacter beijingensis TaxID=1207056 RepID=A0ABW4IHJ8_9SPHI
MSTLILVRHGQSLWNLENRFTGWQNIDITAEGIKEAEHAGKELSGQTIDIAFTSTLIRAQHTLDIIIAQCKLQNLPVITASQLNERSYGSLEGLNKAETAKKFGEEQVHIWRRSFDVAPPDGESLKDTYNRVIPYFKKEILPYLLQNKNVLIVAHGNSLRALIMFLEELNVQEIVEREIPTGKPLIYNLNKQSLEKLQIATGGR